MCLLALECSSDRRSVAVAVTTGVLAESARDAGRSTPLFALIDEALQCARLQKSDIERIGVGLGPGSYTGIRAALAVAYGWTLARSTPLVGFSSADACALAAARNGWRGPAALVIDAQRNEFYTASYELAPRGFVRQAALRLVSRVEIERSSTEGIPLFGPDLASSGLDGLSVMPDATAIAELMLFHGESARHPYLEPIYLRPHSFVKAAPARTIPDLPVISPPPV